MSKKLTTEEFIQNARHVHGDKYDYSKVEYINSSTKVCISCPEHGEFWQTPYTHLRKCGCPKCSKNYKLDNYSFIQKAKEVHGDNYDYSKVEYKGANIKVCIMCPKHGLFWQTPCSHLSGSGCIICANKKPHTKETFIQKAKETHGDKYDYSKVEYINNKTKVCIICPKHGPFWMKPEKHMNQKHGCPKCGGTKKLTTEEFIEKAKQIHGDKYNYSKVEYKGADIKVCIICPKHGLFWQTPHAHLRKQSCPYCNLSKLENEIKVLLDNNHILYEQEKKFDWLIDKSNLRLDFYLPDYNVVIECQGKQHFESVDFFGGNERFNKTKRIDKLKFNLCKKHNIRIIYYSYKKRKYFCNIETNLENILKIIKNE